MIQRPVIRILFSRLCAVEVVLKLLSYTMPLTNTQFSLSVELTRVQPLKFLADNIGSATVALLRNFQNSGSDVLAENDVAELFRCHQIDENMAKVFREAIVHPQSSIWTSWRPLFERLFLDSQPGPTVVRALGQREYFPMVIECSFLAWIHERRSLATAFKRFFEKDLEDAPPDIIAANPKEENIVGIIKACEDQTAAFSWEGYIRAASADLHLSADQILSPLPPVVFRSALRMFPILQSLYEQRTMVINCSKDDGVCALIVWAHHILGLNVLTNTYIDDPDSIEDTGPRQSVLFGKSFEPAQVILNLEKRSNVLSVILMAESETLFHFVPDIDEPVIDAIHKIPARGFGKHLLETLYFKKGKESAVEQMKHITCAFAMILSRHLSGSNYPTGAFPIELNNSLKTNCGCSLSEQQLTQVMRLVFDDECIAITTVEENAVIYSGKRFDEHLEIPRPVVIAYQETHGDGLHSELAKFLWRNAVDRMRKLSVLILALSFVRNCAKLSEFLLCNAQNFEKIMEIHPLPRFFKDWDGKSRINVSANTWFHAVALLMGGHKANLDYGSMSLLSSHGWSVFISTYGISDPSLTDAGYITIHPGVPSRDGIRKHAIIDGPLQGVGSGDWGIIERSGMATTLRCHKKIEFHNPLIGESSDAFFVNLRMVDNDDNRYLTRRTGYLELFHSNWGLQKTEFCDHKPTGVEKLTLPLGCATASDFTDSPESRHPLNEQLLVYLTAGNHVSRWRALLAISHYHRHVASAWDDHRQVLLRETGCCFQCTIDQAFLQGGRWFIVL